MDNPIFTIFTPTYNRAHTLSRLHESLKVQSFKDFEWLIVDDGSTDETESLIQTFIAENELNIRYYKQENQGKHIAINTALKLLKGKYFLTVDSDDYLVENALSVCENLVQKIDEKPEFGGFSFIHFSNQIQFDKEKYGNKEWTELNTYQWEFKGEMGFVFKSEVAQKFPFPIFKEEKFCQESVFLIPIFKSYKILFTDHVLAHGDYLEDGLSQNLYKRLLENPRYAMLSYSQKINFPNYKSDRKQMIVNYWDIALKSKKISWKDKFAGLSWRDNFWFWKRKIEQKIKR